jgi:eukaryotic-like serine/threonine-protein kinase
MIGKHRHGGDLVKVVDFGIARVMGSATQVVTSTGFAIGTPDYMSPEQILGGQIDGRSDIFALGLLLYKMLVAQLPWTAPDAQAAIFQRLNSPPKTLAELSPETKGWPSELQRILDRAIATRPADRYPAAAELATDLNAIGQARFTNEWEASLPTLTPRPAPVVRSSLLASIPMRRVLAGAAGVALVAIGVAFFPGRKPKPPRMQFVQSSGSTLPRSADSLPAIMRAPRETAAPARTTPPPRRPRTSERTKVAVVPVRDSSISPEVIRTALNDIRALTDARNFSVTRAQRGLREAQQLLPRLTSSADSVEARYYMIEALLGLDRLGEACRTLLAIDAASRTTPFAAGVGNLLRDSELDCRNRY